MHNFAHALFRFFWELGGPGLLLLGILDSSFLFAPLGNDLLVVALSAHYHSVPRMLYYAAMSTIGSVLGCLLVDMILRPAGEHGLAKHLPARRIGYIKAKVERNAAWALIVASVAPPPFPFTPVHHGRRRPAIPAQENARHHRRRAHGALHCDRRARPGLSAAGSWNGRRAAWSRASLSAHRDLRRGKRYLGRGMDQTLADPGAGKIVNECVSVS